MNAWASAEEFPRANEIAALAQSHDKLTAGMQHHYACCISYIYAYNDTDKSDFKLCPSAGCNLMQTQPMRSKLCMVLSACTLQREPRIWLTFTRPFSLLKGGVWGRHYNQQYVIVHVYTSPCSCILIHVRRTPSLGPYRCSLQTI